MATYLVPRLEAVLAFCGLVALLAPAYAGSPTTPPAQAALGTLSESLTPPPLLPSSVFAERAFIRQPVLSPSGRQLLARVTVDGHEKLLVHDLTAASRSHLLALPEQSEIVRYRWAGDDRFLVSAGWTIKWRGDDYYVTRLFLRDLIGVLQEGRGAGGQSSRGQQDFDLDSISPLQQVAQLRVPVLVVHGEKDKTCSVEAVESVCRGVEEGRQSP